MKKLVLVIIIFIFMGLFGFGGYMAALEFASDQVVKQVSAAITEEELEILAEDPAIKDLLLESGDLDRLNLDSANLPFKTKEEAITKLKEKFTLKELKAMIGKVKGGLTIQEKDELFIFFTSRLTEEEFTALKIIAVKEIRKNQ